MNFSPAKLSILFVVYVSVYIECFNLIEINQILQYNNVFCTIYPCKGIEDITNLSGGSGFVTPLTP